MSLLEEFQTLSRNGACVCDFDVACPLHPSTSCSVCEYACHCVEHDLYSPECEQECTFDRNVTFGQVPDIQTLEDVEDFLRCTIGHTELPLWAIEVKRRSGSLVAVMNDSRRFVIHVQQGVSK